MVWTEPLSLQTILVNTFAGNELIFVGIALAMIAGAAAYFRMNNSTALLLVGLFSLMFASFLDTLKVFTLLIGIIGSFLFYLVLSRLFK